MKTASKVLLIVTILALTLKTEISATTSANNYHQKYEGYKIYDISIDSDKQYHLFQQTFQNTIDVMGGERRRLRVLLSPVEATQVEEFMRSNNLKFQLINGNVSESIRAERLLQRSIRSVSQDDIIDFESYQRFDVINRYLEHLQKQYPKQVNIVELGESYEGRPLKAIHITSSRNESKTSATEKPLILIDAGIHAREWISQATALYAIQQLVENATFYQRELLMYDWLIWPVVNPDGYEYSHDHERMWRKTRQPNGNGTCIGVDLNRNFDFYWAYVGSSDKPCDIDYQGPRAFSEPEAVALRDLLLRVNATCKMYLTLHSFGNYLLYPWGYDKKLPSNWRYLDAVAQAGSKAIKQFNGTSYTVGSSTNVLYAASGASDDYAFGVAHIPVVLCMELPSGGNGFDPPANSILPLVSESWLGIRAMALEAAVNPLRNVANLCVTNLLLPIVLMISIVLVI